MWGFWLAVAGVLLGFFGIVYGAWARSHPKRSVILGRISESALFTGIETDHHVQVMMDGSLVPEPHLVRLTITNLGPNDLGPAAFAGGYLRCVTPPPTPRIDDRSQPYDMAPIAILQADTPCGVVHPEPVGATVLGVDIAACQLRVGESATIVAMIAGNPEFSWQDKLIGFALETARGERPADLELSIRLPTPFGSVPFTMRRVRL